MYLIQDLCLRYKELSQPNTKKTNNLFLKMGKRFVQVFNQKRYTDGK